jgi:hypothetical protein
MPPRGYGDLRGGAGTHLTITMGPGRFAVGSSGGGMVKRRHGWLGAFNGSALMGVAALQFAALQFAALQFAGLRFAGLRLAGLASRCWRGATARGLSDRLRSA